MWHTMSGTGVGSSSPNSPLISTPPTKTGSRYRSQYSRFRTVRGVICSDALDFREPTFRRRTANQRSGSAALWEGMESILFHKMDRMLFKPANASSSVKALTSPDSLSCSQRKKCAVPRLIQSLIAFVVMVRKVMHTSGCVRIVGLTRDNLFNHWTYPIPSYELTQK